MDKPLPPLLRDDPPETNRKRSQRNERRVAKALGATLTPNSGATPFRGAKGDMQTDQFMWEDKLTSDDRLVLSRRDITKLCREAAAVGKWPGFTMNLEGLPDHTEKEWVAVPMHVWQYLMEDEDG